MLAHVKWFSEFTYADRPLTIGEAVTPLVIALAILSAVVIACMVPLERAMARSVPYMRLNTWLEARRHESLAVLRVAAGASLLLAWQAGNLLVPELKTANGVLGWSQFGIVLLLLFPATVPAAGVGILALYAIGIAHFGTFHMLDYLVYVGVGVALIVMRSPRDQVSGIGIPALYLTLGFSLCWVALEKIIYPQWGLYVLQQHPQLAMGLDLRFFLVGAAFVELSLGYLLIIGLLERPMALTITLVFFTTTMIFGKTEVIGHTLIHGALIVFLLEGPGRVYKAPVRLHLKTSLRAAFAGVNFVLLVVLLMVPYAWGAWRAFVENGGR